MLEFIEKALLTAVGAASVTQKKCDELVAEMKNKYKLTEEEGKHLLAHMQTFMQSVSGSITNAAELEVKNAAERLGLVQREEYLRLLARVEALENALKDQN